MARLQRIVNGPSKGVRRAMIVCALVVGICGVWGAYCCATMRLAA
jgi:hypothetical protein